MSELFSVPRIGGKIFEGCANGFALTDLCYALSQEPLNLDTLKGYNVLAYRALGLSNNPLKPEIKKQFVKQNGRALGMCIVAGLLRREDVKLPGQYFKFTMEPRPDCPIQYHETYTKAANPHVWPTTPVIAMRVPNGPPRGPYRIPLAAEERSYLSAVLQGLSRKRIVDEKLSSSTPDQIKYKCKQTGFKGVAQLSAYCAVNQLITVPEEVLSTQPQDVRPIRYDNPIILELPRVDSPT